MQEELKKLKGKIKIKNQMALTQEAHLGDIKEKNDELNNDLLKSIIINLYTL